MTHAELFQLFTEDQRDREDFPPVPSPEAEAVGARDRARLARVQEIVAAGGAVDADDCFHARRAARARRARVAPPPLSRETVGAPSPASNS